MNKIKKMGLIVACILGTVTSCQKDLDDDINAQNANLEYTSKTVTIEAIPEISSFIDQNIGSPATKTSITGKSDDTNAPKMIFDKTSAIEVQEKDGSKKYTFTFRYNNTPASVFYNLVVYVMPDGKKSAYVMRFTCDDAYFDQYQKHNYNFYYFQGKMDLFPVNAFFKTTVGITSKSAQTNGNCPIVIDANGDPVPQVTAPVGTGGSGGGSFSGGSAPGGSSDTGGGGATGSCRIKSYSYSCWCLGELVGVHDHQQPVLYYYVVCSTKKANSVPIDCPKVILPIGIIGAVDTDPLAFAKFLKTTLSLTNAQYILLRNRPDMTAAFYSYLDSHNNSPEAKAIVIAEINRLIKTTDPCAKLLAQKNSDGYKLRLADLKTKTGLPYESGYKHQKSGALPELKRAKSTATSDGLTFDFDKETIGYMHTHPDKYETEEMGTRDSYKIFSPGDIKEFLILITIADLHHTPLEDLYGMVVTSTGTYEFKFTGSLLGQNVNLDWKSNAMEDTYKRAIRKYGLEEGLLHFTKDYLGISGIELYKAEDDGSYKNIKLVDGIATTTACK
jgi:hypothetical protein